MRTFQCLRAIIRSTCVQRSGVQSGGIGVIEPGQPLAAKFGFHHPDRQQVALLDRAPLARPIQAAARDEDVHMRVETQGPPPGVQRAEQADLGAEIPVIAQQLV
jgi:hypothetical protein